MTGVRPSSATPVTNGLGMRILDVGHGNSAVIWDGTTCSVVDVAPGDLVKSELQRLRCDRIEHLVVSHSDSDHAGGAGNVILDPARTIGTVWYNADGGKNTAVWEKLHRAIHARKRAGGLDGHQAIHTEIGRELHNGRAWLEVVHPSIVMAGTGPTKHHRMFGTLTANTVSVVVKVHLDKVPAVLLAADIDDVALRTLEEFESDLSAPVLVFPHHGGRPGRADPARFAERMTQLVVPKVVVFSILSGGRANNPHPDVVAAVRKAAPDAHIACTQVSRHCHSLAGPLPDDHLATGEAAGRSKGRCCVGSLTVTKTNAGLEFEPLLPDHALFVSQHVNAPMCRTAVLPMPRVGDIQGG
ncbi:beta-lactamase superfamily II metal-dependent hydrolase [Embleya sp. AB8]